MSPTTPTIVHFDIFPAVGMVDADAEPPAERRSIGELTTDDLLTDDRDRRRVGRIGIGEVASGDLRNAQRGEEVRRDGPDVAARHLPIRRPRLIDAPETRADAGKWNGHARRARDRLYAGERSDSGHRIAKQAARCQEVVARCRQLHARGEHAVDAKSEVDALELDQASHQQTGARQQHERERDLDHDQRTKHAVPSPAAAVTPAFAYRVARVVGGHECGSDAERDAGDERGNQGKGDHRKIHRHLVQPWYRDPIAHEREQATMTECRNAQARNAAHGGEHQALGQHLAHQPSASGTKRGTQPDLALSRRAARQQQVRDVDAADEQHQSDRGHQREQCRRGSLRPFAPEVERA